MCDCGEEYERMDYEEEEEKEEEEGVDDDSLLADEDLKSLLRQQQKITKTEETKTKRRINNNDNYNNINAGGFRGSTITELLTFHDTEKRKIPLHDKELHEDMLRHQLTKEQTKEHFVWNNQS